MKTEYERLEIQYNEELAAQQSRYNIDCSNLREQLAEAEAQRDLLEREVQFTKSKFDKSRMESQTDSEETISEIKRMHDRDKLILIDENMKLVQDKNMVISELSNIFTPNYFCSAAAK
jgi:serine/threonine-protein kinase MRCK